MTVHCCVCGCEMILADDEIIKVSMDEGDMEFLCDECVEAIYDWMDEYILRLN